MNTVISKQTINGQFKATFQFNSPVSRENSFTSTFLSNDATSEIEVTIDMNTGLGFFEWEIPELDEYASGGLWFEDRTLTDYDGVFALPQQLISFLEENSFDMTWAKD